jgi:hypothetical protein
VLIVPKAGTALQAARGAESGGGERKGVTLNRRVKPTYKLPILFVKEKFSLAVFAGNSHNDKGI